MVDEQRKSFHVSITGDGLSVERDVDLETAWSIVSVLFGQASATPAPARNPGSSNGTATPPAARPGASAAQADQANQARPTPPEPAQAETARQGSAMSAFQRLQQGGDDRS